MIDVLTTTRDGRLAVVELKADEDIHLPLQGLDYWSRVEWHHSRGEFPRFGYFPDRELSDEAPLLFLVAPAFHVHPATDVLLRYIAPEIEWEFVGIDERWREGVKVVFRKREPTSRGMESNYLSRQQAEPTSASRLGTLLGKVRLLYIRDFWRWFAITAPTSVTAAFILVMTEERARAIFRSIPRGTLQYHSSEIAEATLFRFGGYFIGWLLGCFALGAVATVVSGLDDTDGDAWQRDSHQRAREHFGALFLVALLTFIALLVGTAAYGIVAIAAIKVVGWARFAPFNFAAALIGILVVASIVSWFGMAIPLILRGEIGAWLGMKKSLEAADGNQGFLFLLVLQALVGSYVAWYATHYGLQLLLPASIRFSSWYAWIALVVSALASAAVQPPMFIGFSLLADESSRTASDAQTPSPSLSCRPLIRF